MLYIANLAGRKTEASFWDPSRRALCRARLEKRHEGERK